MSFRDNVDGAVDYFDTNPCVMSSPVLNAALIFTPCYAERCVSGPRCFERVLLHPKIVLPLGWRNVGRS